KTNCMYCKREIIQITNPSVGTKIKIDGDTVVFFRIIIDMNGSVKYQLAESLQAGFPSYELKKSQFKELLECGRLVFL
ncbi:MAG TPA: hypothetical protein PLX90_10005, partial [Anaerolineales bacterium]|nr:hypothetical protein [Anaerolineales bacterium]